MPGIELKPSKTARFLWKSAKLQAPAFLHRLRPEEYKQHRSYIDGKSGKYKQTNSYIDVAPEKYKQNHSYISVLPEEYKQRHSSIVSKSDDYPPHRSYIGI